MFQSSRLLLSIRNKLTGISTATGVKLRNNNTFTIAAQFRAVHCTVSLAKENRGDRRGKSEKIKNERSPKNPLSGDTLDHIAGENELLTKALKEMRRLEEQLMDILSKHFSLQVDLRVYEEITVTMDTGESYPMNHLGRITLKNPHLVCIDLMDNPRALSRAKLAIEKSALNINPQIDGLFLYLPVPRMTRERRQQLCAEAEKTIFNDYKLELNKVYTKIDKSARTERDVNIREDTCHKLLEMKRAVEVRGHDLIKAKQKELMQEVI